MNAWESPCVSVIHRMVDAPKVAAVTPTCDHGDTADSPRPVPSTNKISDSAAAAAAPARIAAHETAPVCAARSFAAAPGMARVSTDPSLAVKAGTVTSVCTG